MNHANGSLPCSNDDGQQQQQQTISSISSQPQQVMSGAVIAQQASHIHAAQQLLQQQQQQHQRMHQGVAAVQYAVAYPTVIPLPNGGAYSIIQAAPATSMHQPQGQMVAYPNGQVAYHLSPALLNAHASLYPRFPGMMQTQQQPQQLHIPGMVQSAPNIRVQPQQMISASQWPSLGQTTTATAILEPKKEKAPASVQQTRKPYRDFAKDPTSNVPSTNQRSNKDQTFPVILYRILSNSECKDYISWLPHGRAFRIHKPEDVEENVLPLYFRHTKFASFMRQVNGWGFRRIPTGPDRNAYYHEMFLRGFPYLCAKMRRPIHKLKSSSEPKTHPNFYDTKLVALNEERGGGVAVTTSESSASPTNISSDSAATNNPDTDGSGSDNNQTSMLFHRNTSSSNSTGGGGPNISYPEYGMSNLYNSSGGEDSSSSRLGGNLYGSVNGSDGSNPSYASGSSEQGCGSDNGSSGGDGGGGGERGSCSPPIHNINDTSDGGIGSFDPSAAYVSSSRPSGSSSDSGEGGTTSDGSSSGAAQKGPSSSSQSNNGKTSSPSSNGNSSDGSGSGGSFLHLLTDTALRAAALSTPHHHQQGGGGAPAFVGGDSSGQRDNISILGGSDNGTEPAVSELSFSRWTSPRKRAHRLVVARKITNNTTANNNNAQQQQGESSDGSSSDDRGGR